MGFFILLHFICVSFLKIKFLIKFLKADSTLDFTEKQKAAQNMRHSYFINISVYEREEKLGNQLEKEGSAPAIACCCRLQSRPHLVHKERSILFLDSVIQVILHRVLV